MDIWLLNEVEHLGYLLDDARTSRHHKIVGIDFGIALMKVTRADAGDVSFLRLDIEQFGVHLQAFNTEDDIHALVLHALTPLDVTLLIEACKELHHSCHLLTITSGTDKRFDNLGVLSQTVERRLDGFHLRFHGCFLQHSDITIERMIRHMDETILLTNLIKDTLRSQELRLHQMLPCWIFQFVVSTAGERHQILMILITATCKGSVELINVEALKNLLLDITRHLTVIEHTYSITFLTALHASLDTLHRTIVLVVVDIHLGILRELKRISAISSRLHAQENKRQAVTDYIIQINNIIKTLTGRQFDPTAHLTVRNLHNGIVGLFFVILLFTLHNEVDTVIFQSSDIIEGTEPDRIDGTVELIVIELLEESFLLLSKLCLINEADTMLTQQDHNAIYSLSIFLTVFRIKLIDGLEGFLQGVMSVLVNGRLIKKTVD